jgi:predicted  nucleic acid-binding Zn-ribbon protein
MFALAGLLAAATAPGAVAQTAPGPASSPTQLQQPVPTPAARARAIQEQLVAIRADTLAANEDLAERKEALDDLLLETMRANGHTPEADIAKLREIRDQLEDGSLSATEQQTLQQEFLAVRATLAGAQQQAMATEAVQTQGRAYQEELLAAMREQDARTDALLQRMSRLQSEMQGGR